MSQNFVETYVLISGTLPYNNIQEFSDTVGNKVISLRFELNPDSDGGRKFMAQVCAKRTSLPQPFIDKFPLYSQFIYRNSATLHQKIRRATKYSIFDDMKSRKGFNVAYVCNKYPGAVELIEEPSEVTAKFLEEGQIKTPDTFIQILHHTVPWILLLIKQYNLTLSDLNSRIHAETDTSFSLVHPYLYMTIMLTLNGSGYPVSVTIYPSEKSELIKLGFDLMHEYICYLFYKSAQKRKLAFPLSFNKDCTKEEYISTKLLLERNNIQILTDKNQDHDPAQQHVPSTPENDQKLGENLSIFVLPNQEDTSEEYILCKKDVLHQFLDENNKNLHYKNWLIESDMGAALQKFFNEENIDHRFCLRHFVESFGANSKLRDYLVQLYHLCGNQEWESLRQKICSVLCQILSEKTSNPDYQEKKAATYFGLVFYFQGGKFAARLLNDKDEGYMDYITNYLKLWAPWLRDGMPTTTNLIEGYHWLNLLAIKLKWTFAKRVISLFDKIDNYGSKAKNLNGPMNYEIKLIKTNAMQQNVIPNAQCKCEGAVLFFQRYHQDYFCIHRAKANLDSTIPQLHDFPSFEDSILDIKPLCIIRFQKENKYDLNSRSFIDFNAWLEKNKIQASSSFIELTFKLLNVANEMKLKYKDTITSCLSNLYFKYNINSSTIIEKNTADFIMEKFKSMIEKYNAFEKCDDSEFSQFDEQFIQHHKIHTSIISEMWKEKSRHPVRATTEKKK